MRLCLLFTLVLMALSPLLKAQENVNNVIIYSDPYLDTLIQRSIVKNENNKDKTLEGYRIQLFSGNDRENATAIKAKFVKQHPEQPVYLMYHQPYFKVRVGDFRNRIEAQELFHELLEEFDGAIIIPDKINLPKL